MDTSLFVYEGEMEIAGNMRIRHMKHIFQGTKHTAHGPRLRSTGEAIVFPVVVCHFGERIPVIELYVPHRFLQHPIAILRSYNLTTSRTCFNSHSLWIADGGK